jgi:hypothetical protein
MDTDGSYQEGFLMLNAIDGELEDNLAVAVTEGGPVRRGNTYRGTGFGSKVKRGDNEFVDEIQCCTTVEKGRDCRIRMRRAGSLGGAEKRSR